MVLSLRWLEIDVALGMAKGNIQPLEERFTANEGDWKLGKEHDFQIEGEIIQIWECGVQLMYPSLCRPRYPNYRPGWRFQSDP